MQFLKTIILTILLTIITNSAFAYTIQGKVVYVYDGDTILLQETSHGHGVTSALEGRHLETSSLGSHGHSVTSALEGRLLRSHRIRLASIDAPEKNQPYGLEATMLLKRLLLNKTISVDVIDIDKYNREIGRITTPNNICCTMLANGLAWHLSYFDRSNPDYAEHAKLQHMAKTMRIGLWKQDKPVEPWRWRK